MKQPIICIKRPRVKIKKGGGKTPPPPPPPPGSAALAYNTWKQKSGRPRAAERIGGAQDKYKKWGPSHRLCEEDLGNFGILHP